MPVSASSSARTAEQQRLTEMPVYIFLNPRYRHTVIRYALIHKIFRDNPKSVLDEHNHLVYTVERAEILKFLLIEAYRHKASRNGVQKLPHNIAYILRRPVAADYHTADFVERFFCIVVIAHLYILEHQLLLFQPNTRVYWHHRNNGSH